MEVLEAAYTAPGGRRRTFLFERLSRETALKTAEFTFPGFDGAQFQSLGLGARKFPLTCIFSGADSAGRADEFESLLFERGAGVLELPFYGKIRAVPTGTVKRSDDLVKGVGESVVEVTFAESAESDPNPGATAADADEAERAADDFADAAAESAERTAGAESRAAFAAEGRRTLDSLASGAESLARKEPDAGRRRTLLQRLASYKSAAQSALGKAAGFAGGAARSLVNIARLPARVSVDVLAKVQAYADMMDAVSRSVLADPLGGGSVLSQLALTSASMGALVAGLSEGLAEDALKSAALGRGRFRSREDVLRAADGISTAFSRFQDFLDGWADRQLAVDSGSGYAEVQRAAAAARRAVVGAAAGLSSVRAVALDRDRNLLELVAELYGADGLSRLDEFIVDNALSADELSVIPMGRVVRYYV